jgi:hypothetical protein
MADHKAQPVIMGLHMECRECGGRVYQRLFSRMGTDGRRTMRHGWSHLGYRNTTGLRRSLMERSGGTYEGENFGTGRPGR